MSYTRVQETDPVTKITGYSTHNKASPYLCKMFNSVRNKVGSLYNFSVAELDHLDSMLISRHLKKDDFLLTEKQTCDFIAFVLRGSFRHFSVSEEREITFQFFTEKDWVIDQQSFVTQSPSGNKIQANEDSEIAILPTLGLHHLVYRYPNFLRLGKILEQNLNNRVRLDLDKSPDDRYRTLLESHPVWIERFAQKHIASYLGITPETLSRVRARIT